MADIELVVKLPKEQYDLILKSDIGATSVFVSKECMMYSIKNGTPLPKGHGDLKDMRHLPYVFDLTREDPIYSGKDIEWAIKSMKTIVEADKAESEG